MRITILLILFISLTSTLFSQTKDTDYDQSSIFNTEEDKTFFQPKPIIYTSADTNFEKNKGPISTKVVLEIGLNFNLGFPQNIENVTLERLATFGTFRGGVLGALLYTPTSLYGVGIEVGYQSMTVGIGIGNVNGKLRFVDIPARVLGRFGFKVFYLEAYGGIIWQKLIIYGENNNTGESAELIRLHNPFNADVGCRFLFGGAGKYFIEVGYVYGILLNYPKIGAGFKFNFLGI